MKKIISTVLILLILIQTSSLKEFIKTPVLIHHYFEHIISHPEDNFISFILKHYSDKQESDSAHDKKTDAQLPFKSADSFPAHISAFIIPKIKITAVILNVESAAFFSGSASDILTRSFDIWQPPKLTC